MNVSFERHDNDEDDFLQKIESVEADAIVRLQTSSQGVWLDIRKLAADEVNKMRKLLKKMNYDQKFQTSGI